ncbi:cupin domain-containing protein [Agromyces archimandritae]|uniref:Cupin domain-containing protein n=1 Tax=Agromyces archimandritae TaxID=2781962 RepID=A0A975IPS9_9MICO|nr:cupin domain-containing protein [Agromyces archimandritae]QTX05614.1 cupin domain-containing protein [Agromyces archimandritae]
MVMGDVEKAALLAADAETLLASRPYVEGRVAPARLFGGASVRVMLLAFDAGQVMSEHRVTVPILVQPVEGRVTVEVAGDEPAAHELGAGGILYVPADLPHTVVATERARVMVTMCGPIPHAADRVEG